MAGRAVHGAQSDARAVLVKLGRLCFDDFLQLSPRTLDCEHWTPDIAADWTLATNNAPHIQRHFRFQIADCRFPEATIDSIRAAQARLVSDFAYDLLRAKAPPLYDALPWHDWDFSIVTRRFPLWRTKLLLAGDGTTVTMCRCRKSAGVYAVEPNQTIARYTERKAEMEKARRLRVLNSSLTSSLPLPASSVDLAIIGSVPSLDAAGWKSLVRELARVAASVLLIENNPLCRPLDETSLTDSGFRSDSVEVSGLGRSRCWWRPPA